jgi:hypothetical protein
MHRHHRAFVALPLPVMIAFAACGNATAPSGGIGGGGGGGGQSMEVPACASDARVTAFAAGLEAKAQDGKVRVTFVSATPAPPAKGTNAFTIDVADESGAPIDGASIVVKPFMPDHGHGASVVPKVAAGAQAGRYEVSDVELFMPGVWEITFEVTPAGGAMDAVKLAFCVAG